MFYTDDPRQSLLKILADSKIPRVADYFDGWGQIQTMDRGQIDNRRLRNIDLLLVRSETTVNAELLEGTAVKFVGSPTSGIDHIDTAYLQAAGIGFAQALGSNARSVAEYVVAALLTVSQRRGERLAGKTLGIVGVGNIGSLVSEMAKALQMEVLKNDPPKQLQTGDTSFVSLDEILQCDFVTLHVPLSKTSKFPTFHLLDKTILNKLSRHCVLVNTARGAVVDNQALLQKLESRTLGGAVLDVWEKEPEILMPLLKSIDIGTPHIAGYSWDGKIKGTEMVYAAACKHFNVERPFKLSPEDGPRAGVIDWTGNEPFERELKRVIDCLYNIEIDDSNLRRSLQLSASERPSYFSDLRKNFRIRREFGSQALKILPRQPELCKGLQMLGFNYIT